VTCVFFFCSLYTQFSRSIKLNSVLTAPLNPWFRASMAKLVDAAASNAAAGGGGVDVAASGSVDVRWVSALARELGVDVASLMPLKGSGVVAEGGGGVDAGGGDK
jgi:hypothetical protein